MMDGLKVIEGEHVLDGVNRLSAIIYKGLHEYDNCLSLIALDDLHLKIDAHVINPLRLSLFRYLNGNQGEHDDLLHGLLGDTLNSIIGPDVLIQTKLNLSIQLPNDETSTLDLHSDCWSGDTPYQVNLWIPLTDCFGTNSMFLLNKENSFECLSKIKTDPLIERKSLFDYVKSSDFLSLRRGQAIVFNPGLIHGNVRNDTSKTRVSINIRFKGLFSPDAEDVHISRAAGAYFRMFRMSNWTQLASDISHVNSCL